jgi:hypothetical protein
VSFGIGAGFGPAIFGWAFGLDGSYALIFRVASGVLAASALSLLALGRYPRFAVRGRVEVAA